MELSLPRPVGPGRDASDGSSLRECWHGSRVRSIAKRVAVGIWVTIGQWRRSEAHELRLAPPRERRQGPCGSPRQTGAISDRSKASRPAKARGRSAYARRAGSPRYS
ncbi:hypothetical protein BO1005MUT1_380046 [Hyphomicrobiales bacterium]|nr:hypothetical protein BO1005MUT1_380046 [Hyphomicrobiales bacterium]